MIRCKATVETLLIACLKLGRDSSIEIHPEALDFIRSYSKKHEITEALIDILDEEFPSGWWRYRGQYDGAPSGPEVRGRPHTLPNEPEEPQEYNYDPADVYGSMKGNEYIPDPADVYDSVPGYDIPIDVIPDKF